MTSSAQEARKAAGLSTCSTTSMEHTTSNRFGSSRTASADVCLYVRDPLEEDSGDRRGSAEAWRDAMAILDSDASMPSVRAPIRAKLCRRR